MYARDFSRDKLLQVADCIERLPKDAHFRIGDEISNELTLSVQARTLGRVTQIRSALGCQHMTKRYVDDCGWWEYQGRASNGCQIFIYACTETPKTCPNSASVNGK